MNSSRSTSPLPSSSSSLNMFLITEPPFGLDLKVECECHNTSWPYFLHHRVNVAFFGHRVESCFGSQVPTSPLCQLKASRRPLFRPNLRCLKHGLCFVKSKLGLSDLDRKKSINVFQRARLSSSKVIAKELFLFFNLSSDVPNFLGVAEHLLKRVRGGRCLAEYPKSSIKCVSR